MAARLLAVVASVWIAAAGAEEAPSPRGKVTPPPISDPVAPTPEKSNPDGTGRFSSRLVVVRDDFIARAQAKIVEQTASSGNKTRLKRPWPPEFSVTGKYAGIWLFEPNGDRAPTHAWQDVDASGPSGYASERIGYCRDSRRACERWFETGRFHSRRPIDGVHRLAYRQWMDRVTEEPCTSSGDFRPSLAPVKATLSATAQGGAKTESIRMALFVLLNPCGEVRDALVVESSPRIPTLEPIVVEWALHMRSQTTIETFGTLHSRGAAARLPFTLSVE